MIIKNKNKIRLETSSKILVLGLILIVLAGFFNPVHNTYAQETSLGTCTDTVDGSTTQTTQTNCVGQWETKTATDTTYVLLAPLPCDSGEGCVDGKLTTFDPAGENKIGAYLNTMIRIFIGLCAILAVVMIVMGGIEYMTSELPGNKEHGKERIMGAIFGLILALGSWTILYQINPKILDTDLKSLKEVTVEVTLDEANFSKTEQTVASSGTKYATSGSSSSGVSDFVNQHLKKGEPLTNIVVDTAAKKAYFYVGNDWKTAIAVPINLGLNGVSEAGKAQSGDMKTPKGITTISSTAIGSNGNSILSKNKQYNLGAAFVNIGATANGADRGIGFHGSANNALGTTAGCIRMSNDDLTALAPYMKVGVKVIVK